MFFTILFVIITTAYNIFYLKAPDELTKNIGLIIVGRNLLKLPNQICISFNDPNGWINVVESIVAVASVMIMNHYTNKHKKNMNNTNE